MTHLRIVTEKAILLNIMDQKAWQTNVTLTNIIIILKNAGLHCYKDYNNFYFSLVQGGGVYY